MAFWSPLHAAPSRPLAPAGRAGERQAPYARAPAAISGTWTKLTAPFPGATPDTAELLTDGTVIMHDGCTSNWYRLTPDANGGYAGGTWLQAAPMPKGYSPLYFASAVLPDGRLIVNGGEYNGLKCAAVWTKKGALYDPVADSWTTVSAPPGWQNIGDAASVVLPSGAYMLQDSIEGVLQAVGVVAPPPGTAVAWKPTGGAKADPNDEEGWTLLPNGDVLTLDITKGRGADTPAEVYSPWTGMWATAPTAPNILVDPVAEEIGPAVLLPSGAVFQTGANSCGAAGCPGHTALYHRDGRWTVGPDFPTLSGGAYDVTDGPAAILPDGHVLIQASPAYGCDSGPPSYIPSPYCAPSHFFEFDGKHLVRVNEPSSAPDQAAYEGRMLVLPTGQVLWSADLGDVEVYTPQGKPLAGWAPVISSAPSVLVRGQVNYLLSGKRLHGVSNGAAYGDDAQMNTNYPILRITNLASGHVCFARVHDHTAKVTYFDLPSATPPAWVRACDTGSSALQAVVNGIASLPVAVSVQ
jgi:hypothetical protein